MLAWEKLPFDCAFLVLLPAGSPNSALTTAAPQVISGVIGCVERLAKAGTVLKLTFSGWI